jgi:hypothetical protein
MTEAFEVDESNDSQRGLESDSRRWIGNQAAVAVTCAYSSLPIGPHIVSERV